MGKSSPFFEHPSLVIFGDFCRPCSVRKSTSSPWMFWEALSKGVTRTVSLEESWSHWTPSFLRGSNLGDPWCWSFWFPDLPVNMHEVWVGGGGKFVILRAGKSWIVEEHVVFLKYLILREDFFFFLKIPYLGDLMFFFEVSQIVYTLRISHDLTSHWWFGDPIQNPAKTRVIHLYFLEGPMILRVYNIVIYFEIYIYIQWWGVLKWLLLGSPS